MFGGFGTYFSRIRNFYRLDEHCSDVNTANKVKEHPQLNVDFSINDSGCSVEERSTEEEPLVNVYRYFSEDVDSVNMEETREGLTLSLRLPNAALEYVFIEQQKNLDALSKSLEARKDGLTCLHKHLAVQEEALARKENELLDQEKALKEKNDAIEKTDEELKKKNSELADEDIKLKERGNTVKKKEEELKRKESELVSKHERLKERSDQLERKDENLKKKDVQLLQENEEWQKKSNILEKKSETLKKKESILIEEEDKLKEKSIMIDKRDEELKKKEKSLFSENEKLAQRDAIVSEREEKLKKIECELVSESNKLKEKSNMLDKKDQELKKKENDLMEKDNCLINNTRSLKAEHSSLVEQQKISNAANEDLKAKLQSSNQKVDDLTRLLNEKDLEEKKLNGNIESLILENEKLNHSLKEHKINYDASNKTLQDTQQKLALTESTIEPLKRSLQDLQLLSTIEKEDIPIVTIINCSSEICKKYKKAVENQKYAEQLLNKLSHLKNKSVQEDMESSAINTDFIKYLVQTMQILGLRLFDSNYLQDLQLAYQEFENALTQLLSTQQNFVQYKNKVYEVFVSDNIEDIKRVHQNNISFNNSVCSLLNIPTTDDVNKICEQINVQQQNCHELKISNEQLAQFNDMVMKIFNAKNIEDLHTQKHELEGSKCLLLTLQNKIDNIKNLFNSDDIEVLNEIADCYRRLEDLTAHSKVKISKTELLESIPLREKAHYKALQRLEELEDFKNNISKVFNSSTNIDELLSRIHGANEGERKLMQMQEFFTDLQCMLADNNNNNNISDKTVPISTIKDALINISVTLQHTMEILNEALQNNLDYSFKTKILLDTEENSSESNALNEPLPFIIPYPSVTATSSDLKATSAKILKKTKSLVQRYSKMQPVLQDLKTSNKRLSELCSLNTKESEIAIEEIMHRLHVEAALPPSPLTSSTIDSESAEGLEINMPEDLEEQRISVWDAFNKYINLVSECMLEELDLIYLKKLEDQKDKTNNQFQHLLVRQKARDSVSSMVISNLKSVLLLILKNTTVIFSSVRRNPWIGVSDSWQDLFENVEILLHQLEILHNDDDKKQNFDESIDIMKRQTKVINSIHLNVVLPRLLLLFYENEETEAQLMNTVDMHCASQKCLYETFQQEYDQRIIQECRRITAELQESLLCKDLEVKELNKEIINLKNKHVELEKLTEESSSEKIALQKECKRLKDRFSKMPNHSVLEEQLIIVKRDLEESQNDLKAQTKAASFLEERCKKALDENIVTQTEIKNLNESCEDLIKSKRSLELKTTDLEKEIMQYQEDMKELIVKHENEYTALDRKTEQQKTSSTIKIAALEQELSLHKNNRDHSNKELIKLKETHEEEITKLHISHQKTLCDFKQEHKLEVEALKFMNKKDREDMCTKHEEAMMKLERELNNNVELFENSHIDSEREKENIKEEHQKAVDLKNKLLMETQKELNFLIEELCRLRIQHVLQIEEKTTRRSLFGAYKTLKIEKFPFNDTTEPVFDINQRVNNNNNNDQAQGYVVTHRRSQLRPLVNSSFTDNDKNPKITPELEQMLVPDESCSIENEEEVFLKALMEYGLRLSNQNEQSMHIIQTLRNKFKNVPQKFQRYSSLLTIVNGVSNCFIPNELLNTNSASKSENINNKNLLKQNGEMLTHEATEGTYDSMKAIPLSQKLSFNENIKLNTDNVQKLHEAELAELKHRLETSETAFKSLEKEFVALAVEKADIAGRWKIKKLELSKEREARSGSDYCSDLPLSETKWKMRDISCNQGSEIMQRNSSHTEKDEENDFSNCSLKSHPVNDLPPIGPSTIMKAARPVKALLISATYRRSTMLRNFPKNGNSVTAFLLGKPFTLTGCENDLHCWCSTLPQLGWSPNNVRILSEARGWDDSLESIVPPDVPSIKHMTWLTLPPTKENILEGLNWLTTDIRSGDRVLLVMEGAGGLIPVRITRPNFFKEGDGKIKNDDYEPCFLPCDFLTNVENKENEKSNKTAVSEIIVSAIPGRQILDFFKRLPQRSYATVVWDFGIPKSTTITNYTSHKGTETFVQIPQNGNHKASPEHQATVRECLVPRYFNLENLLTRIRFISPTIRAYYNVLYEPPSVVKPSAQEFACTLFFMSSCGCYSNAYETEIDRKQRGIFSWAIQKVLEESKFKASTHVMQKRIPIFMSTIQAPSGKIIEEFPEIYVTPKTMLTTNIQF